MFFFFLETADILQFQLRCINETGTCKSFMFIYTYISQYETLFVQTGTCGLMYILFKNSSNLKILIL